MNQPAEECSDLCDADSDQSSLPLAGYRIADFTSALSGPFCTLLLADLGADVIKVERPGGDDSRRWGPPFIADTSSYFLSVNRNKRSLVLDLKDAADRRLARKLVATSDGLVENWRPGVAERLGLGHAKLRAEQPELIYCSLSGFGADQSPLPGYDQIVQGTSGWMSITGTPDEGPTKTGVPIGDVAAGMFCAQMMLASFVRRERTGAGGFVDVSMHDSLVAMLTYQAGRYFATSVAPAASGNSHPTVAPYGTYQAADGPINIAVGNDRQFASLCACVRLDHLVADPRFGDNGCRLANREALDAAISAAVAECPRADLLQRFAASGVPAGPINDLADVFTDPLTLARDMVLSTHHRRLGPLRSTGSPWHLDGRAATARMPPPDLGEHTEELRTELER